MSKYDDATYMAKYIPLFAWPITEYYIPERNLITKTKNVCNSDVPPIAIKRATIGLIAELYSGYSTYKVLNRQEVTALCSHLESIKMDDPTELLIFFYDIASLCRTPKLTRKKVKQFLEKYNIQNRGYRWISPDSFSLVKLSASDMFDPGATCAVHEIFGNYETLAHYKKRLIGACDIPEVFYPGYDANARQLKTQYERLMEDKTCPLFIVTKTLYKAKLFDLLAQLSSPECKLTPKEKVEEWNRFCTWGVNYVYTAKNACEMFKEDACYYAPRGKRTLFIADTHGSGIYGEQMNTDLDGDYDMVVFLGDHTQKDIQTILQRIPDNIPVYGLLGNHDSLDLYDSFDRITHLKNGINDVEGLDIAVFEGGPRYKSTPDLCMYTQEEMEEICKATKGADIVLTHSNLTYNADDTDDAHMGFRAISEYVEHNPTCLYVHGHIHQAYECLLPCGAWEFSVYRSQIITL